MYPPTTWKDASVLRVTWDSFVSHVHLVTEGSPAGPIRSDDAFLATATVTRPTAILPSVGIRFNFKIITKYFA